MHIEDFKTWHWMVLGPIIGLLFGCAILYQGSSADVPGVDPLGQEHFERAITGRLGRGHDDGLIARYAPDHRLIQNITVHPPLPGDATGTYWVLGDLFTVEEMHKDRNDPNSPIVGRGYWTRFIFPAKTPFVAVDVAPGAYANVMGFLDAVKKQVPESNSSYRFAWWDSKAATLALPAMAGFLIIGIAWPTLIHLLQGAGLARVPEPKAKVKLPKSRPAVAKAAVDHSLGNQQLDELNTQLEQDLAAGASASGGKAAAVVVGDAPVKALTAGPDGAAAAAAEKERLIREYGGEFYPVVRTVHKEGDEDEKSE
jgi:hypothetical protein